MTQKIIKIGTSNAVVLPKHELTRLGLKTGDYLSIVYNSKRKIFEIDPHINDVTKVDQESLEWTRKFIKKYRPALEALAKK